MKFNCGESKKARDEREHKQALEQAAEMQKWHTVFVWWPRRVGENDCRWLEDIEQRFDGVRVRYHCDNGWYVEWTTRESRAVESGHHE